MRNLSNYIYQTIGISPALQEKLITSAILLFALAMCRILLLRIIDRRTENSLLVQQWRRAVNYLVMFAAILAIGRVWLAGFETITVFLGLVTAGLCVALKDVLLNIAGWAYILSRKPFESGQRIQIGNNCGDVIEQGLFEFSLMEVQDWEHGQEPTGRVLHVPNAKVFMDSLANYSKGFDYIWNEMSLMVTFESDWEKAKEILKQIVGEHAEQVIKTAEPQVKNASRKLMIYYTNLKSEVFTSVKDHGVQLTVRFVCQPRERRMIEQEIWEDILRQFAKCDDIEFAYPTQRFYNGLVESKSIMRQQHEFVTN